MEIISTPQQFVHFIDFEALPLALTVMVLGLVSIRLIDRFFDNLGERFTDRRLWFKKGAAFARFGLYLLLAVVVLGSVLDLESDAIFALAGTIGLALGFAFKDLFASLMASIILLKPTTSAARMAANFLRGFCSLIVLDIYKTSVTI